MKKILTITIVALVTMTLTTSCGSKNETASSAQDTTATENVQALSVDSIEHIPLTKGFDRVTEYLRDLGYRGDWVMERDSHDRIYYLAWNETDKSIVYVLGGIDLSGNVDKLWIEWKNDNQVPNGLKELETITSFDGKGKCIIGKWKNYYLFSRDGVNFLDGDEPQKIIDDQLWRRTARL